MRAILIVFVAISAFLGVVLMYLAVRDGGFEQPGKVVDRQVDDASVDARRTGESAKEAIKHSIDRVIDTAN